MRGLLTVTALAAVPFLGCGSSSDTTTTPASHSALSAYKGIYVATIKKSDLRREGATEPDALAGMWTTLSIAQTDPNTIRVEPGGFDLQAVAFANGQVTFAPDPSCPSVEGRTKPSVFKIEKTRNGLRFVAVTPACRADSAALVLGDWFRT
jgi:hypothetical protein